MMRLFRDAISILVQQAPLFLPICLLVYLPINFALNYAFPDTESMENLGTEFRVASLADTFIGTLAVAFATLVAARVRMGQQPAFGSTLLQAFKCWPAFVGAGILAGIGITLGLVLLIIPGVYLCLRWAFLFPAIALEDYGVSASFARSSELTQGYKLQVLGSFCLVFIGVIALSIGGYELLYRYLPETWWFGAEVGLDTLIDSAFLVWPILMTLFYLDARAKEAGEDPTAEVVLEEEATRYEVAADEDNPYRAPGV